MDFSEDDLMLFQKELFGDDVDFNFSLNEDVQLPQVVSDTENQMNGGTDVANVTMVSLPNPTAGENYNGDRSSGSNTPCTMRTRKYQKRHTPQQKEILEAAFKESPHLPNSTQLERMCRETGMTKKQIKFWFQNKQNVARTKARQDSNSLLMVENDKLRLENEAIHAALNHPVCDKCRTSVPIDETLANALAKENAQLREQLAQVSTNAGNIVEVQQLEDTVGVASTDQCGATGYTSSIVPYYMSIGYSSSTLQPVISETEAAGVLVSDSLPETYLPESSNCYWMKELALKAMNELLGKTIEIKDTSLWTKGLYKTTAEILNYEAYVRTFPLVLSVTPNPVHEATKDTDIVQCSCQELVDMFTNSETWIKMFPSLIPMASIIKVVEPSFDGSIKLIEAELQVLSPVVPIYKTRFLRYCKRYADGIWVLSDVSVNAFTDVSITDNCLPLQIFPSGCIIEELPEDRSCSKVTWVAHYEYDENVILPPYRPMLRAGLGFGATTWLARLKRYCESMAFYSPSAIAGRQNQYSIPIKSQISLSNLGWYMSDCFCYGVCGTRYQWVTVQTGTLENEFVFLKSRLSMDSPDQPSGIVLSAATSFWLPVTRDIVFRDLKNKWDLFFHESTLSQFIHVRKDSKNEDNCVSVFRCSKMVSETKIIIQETWSDASASFIVYAPIELPDLYTVCFGADASSVTILPSGIAIHSDGNIENGGSLVTIGIQMLVNDDANNGIDAQSIQHMNTLIRSRVVKIKALIGCQLTAYGF